MLGTLYWFALGSAVAFMLLVTYGRGGDLLRTKLGERKQIAFQPGAVHRNDWSVGFSETNPECSSISRRRPDQLSMVQLYRAGFVPGPNVRESGPIPLLIRFHADGTGVPRS